MTPKEKADELVKRMYKVHSDSASSITLYFAKECALITVDEILDSYTKEKKYGYIISDKIIPYWEEVKQEIENYKQQ